MADSISGDTDYRLRPMHPADMQTVFDWRRQPQVARYMFSDDEITLQDHRRWFETTLDDDTVDYRILEYRGRPVGLANAIRLGSHDNQCYWGFYIGDNDAPKGSGTILGKLMLQHIFSHHPVTTVIGEAFAFNTASLKLHDKLGFRQHPELSHSVDKQGQSEQVIVMSLDISHYKDQIGLPHTYP